MMISAAVLLLAVGADRCPALATVHGSPELVAELEALLSERGVRLEAQGSCASLEVRIDGSEGAYRILIRDPWGRAVERTALELSTVAAFVVAWAEFELVEPSPPAEPPAARPRLESTAVNTIQRPSAPVLISAAAEVGAALKKDLPLVGPHLGACVPIGLACLGAAVRYARAGEFQVVDLLLEAALVLVSGRFSVKPSIGIGGGWYDGGNHLYRTTLEARLPRFDPPLTVLVEGGLTVGVRLFSDLHLLLGGSGTAAWSWREDPFGFDEEGSVIRGQLGLLWGAL